MRNIFETMAIEDLVKLHNKWIKDEDIWGYGDELIYPINEAFHDGVFVDNTFKDAMLFFLGKDIYFNGKHFHKEDLKADIKWLMIGDAWIGLYTDDGLREDWIENYLDGYRRYMIENKQEITNLNITELVELFNKVSDDEQIYPKESLYENSKDELMDIMWRKKVGYQELGKEPQTEDYEWVLEGSDYIEFITIRRDDIVNEIMKKLNKED